MQLTIGSRRLRNTDGVISVRGDEQIRFEWGSQYSELLLTMDLYNISGYHIARLRRNHWTFNDRERFRVEANVKGVNLVDTKSSQVVLEARVVGGDAVVVTQGAFHSSAGHEIEIAMEDWAGVVTSQAPTKPTSLPFATDETAAIRKAVKSLQKTIECPRCGGPLTRERLTIAKQADTHLVSCPVCRCNLVVRMQS